MPLTIRRHILNAALRDAWPVWLTLGGLASAILVSYWLAANLSSTVRYTGTILQVLGLATVGVGLRQVRRRFGRPSIVQRATAWLHKVRSAFRPAEPTSVEMKAAGISTVMGRPSVLVKAGPNTPLEQRVALLEKGLDALREELDAVEADIRKEVAVLQRSIMREEEARQANDHRVSTLLEDLAVGGLHLELVGLTWLILGVLGTSIPDEIAKILSRLCVAA